MAIAATDSDPYVGKVFGNVRLIEKIGQGGMGMVYRGVHERFKRDVAVKLLPPHHDEKRLQYQKRFLREGRTAAGIHHRNVVQVMDAGTDHGVAYLVLEYVAGRSIGDVLDESKKMPPGQVERLAIEIADGLHAIHSCKVVHRDIKPDNILLTEHGQAKITDLGLARQLNDPEINRLTATGMVVGTPLYVAPEAIRDTKNAGPKADVYSLGGTLYHMLGGKPPFLGKTPFDVMRAHLDQRPEPLRQLDPAIPKHLASLVQLCMSKDPEERPSAREVSRILRERHLVRDGSGRTTVVLLIAAAVAVISLAVLAWQLIGSQNAGATHEAVQATTRVRLDITPPPGARYRVDDGEWQPLTDDVIELQPGVHRVLIAKQDRGRQLQSVNDIDLVAGEETLLAVDFQPVPTASRQVYHFDAGDGIVYVMGEARGRDDRIGFSEIGTYHLTRFDGEYFYSTTVSVTGNDLTATEPERGSRLPEQGFLRHSVEGHPVEPHHLACWQLVEWARQDRDISAPAAWSAGADRPYADAYNLDQWLVRATESWATRFGLRLPGREIAAELQRVYGSPIWYRDGDGTTIATWPSNALPGNALLALVPADR